MRLSALLCLLLAAAPAWAGFDRPIPQAQTATAEFWFSLGALALLAALAAVHWLVARR